MYGDNMQNINPTFTDKEFEEIKKIKENHGLNWHDFVLDAARLYR